MANNPSVRRHLDDFTRGRIIGKLEEGRSMTSVAAEFGIAHSIVSRLWRPFQTTGTAIRGFSSGRPRGTTPADDRVISDTLGQNIAIFTDSQAAIKTISGYNLFPSELEFKCKQLIHSFLSTGREVFLQWVSLHCVIHGNEQADKLVKEASMLYPPCLPIPLRNAKRVLRDKYCQKRISLLQSWLLGEGVACFRVITGHDYLQAHLFKIGQDDSPLCLLYKSMPMTREHLFDCPSLLHVLMEDNCGVLPPVSVTSALYWTTRRLMSKKTLAGVI
ncbi:uncharacterized protein LOC103524116 [Trichonephila clavipes]|nr:uncharacterized protein LOC103524116 [Trichonephila clavipes]